MAYPMIALTTAGTTFACASVSLTETGLAVLNENGSRTGFVPYDSLEYVAPTEEASVTDPPMRILTEDGSRFGAASISQTGAGVAVLDASGARIGFVPYDTLTYVLPESKTGPTLPADATPVEGTTIEEEDGGGSPVWEDGDETEGDDDEAGGSDGGTENGDEGNSDETEDDGSDENEETGDSENEGGSESGNENEGDSESEGGSDSEEDDGPVWGDDPVAESDRGGDDGSDSGSNDDTDDGQANDDTAENGEREEAEESELVVEWSFGDDG